MPKVVAFEDAKAQQFRYKGNSARTPFFKSSGDVPNSPMAFLLQGDPGRVIKPHFHTVDQFQIIVEGDGSLGREEIGPYLVHFARAYTPYGPIVGGSKSGVSFFTLRSRYDPRALYLPDSLPQLKQATGRKPWQIKRQITFPSQQGIAVQDAVTLQPVPDFKNDQGLFVSALTMAPNVTSAAPDPAHGDGQFLLVVSGSLWHENNEYKAFTVVFVEPKEGPFPLRAGAQGLEALIMNHPLPTAHITTQNVASAAGFRKWQCELCAFTYNEAVGMPEDGIPAGTRWENVPENWTCPDCAAAKSDFRMVGDLQ